MDNVRLIGGMEQYKKVGIKGLVLRPVIPPSKVRHRKEKVKDIFLRDETFVPYVAEEPAAGLFLGGEESGSQE